MRLDLSAFLGQRRFLSVAHHVPGRIRIRLDVTALAHWPNVDPAPVIDLLKSINGVKSARINPVALSMVVEYDTNEIPASLWERLLVGDKAEIEEILAKRVA